MTDLSRIRELAQKWKNGTLSGPEKQELDAWYNTQPGESLQWHTDASEEVLRKRLLTSLVKKIKAEEAPVIPLRTRRSVVRKIAVAAAIILLAVTGSFYLFFNTSGKKDLPVAETTPKSDVPSPVSTQAVITLADGRQIKLSEANTGSLATENGATINKLADGQIAYAPTSPAPAPSYNTIFNPKGSPAVHLKLSDGTRVWLNSESSLRYPTFFTGSDRKVQITGEAYFEVAHDEAKPFYVNKGDVEVQVLGTHFNVNAYDDEQAIKVTLLEGSVKVSVVGGQWSVLKPGQQAALTHSQLTTYNSPNLEEVMAWKNGLFKFDRADIGMVMRQISRWYDIDVEYKGSITQHFGGTISRQVNASKVFEMLEMTGGVKFIIEGKKVTVMP